MKSLVEGRVDGILFAIEVKFGRESETMEKRIRAISTLEEVLPAKEILMQAKTPRAVLRELKAI